jgi:hypothetical protein
MGWLLPQAPSAAQTVVSIRCVSRGDVDPGFCDRWNRDRVSRELLTNEALAPANAALPRFLATFEAALRSCGDGATSCLAHGRDALRSAGFADPQARPVGPDDALRPTLWAVAAHLGGACIVAGWDPVGGRWFGTPDVAGARKTDGRCLGPE